MRFLSKMTLNIFRKTTTIWKHFERFGNFPTGFERGQEILAKSERQR